MAAIVPADFVAGISTHASLAGRDCVRPADLRASRNFNPRVPCGTRLPELRGQAGSQVISTHASLAGRDYRACPTRRRPFLHFNPRVPCGTRLPHLRFWLYFGKISTHASLAGRDLLLQKSPRPRCGISTHASLAGRDIAAHAGRVVVQPISTHASLAGRDSGCSLIATSDQTFQPTRPLRDATRTRRLARSQNT